MSEQDRSVAINCQNRETLSTFQSGDEKLERELALYEIELTEAQELFSLHWANPKVKQTTNPIFIAHYPHLRREAAVEEMYPEIALPRTISSG